VIPHYPHSHRPEIEKHIHGHIILPASYTFRTLPGNTPIEFICPENDVKLSKSHCHEIPDGNNSINVCMYHPPQLDTFGYAAFGLTVVPYALVNLISNITTPDYPYIYGTC
jgi:hypothetical protein